MRNAFPVAALQFGLHAGMMTVANAGVYRPMLLNDQFLFAELADRDVHGSSLPRLNPAPLSLFTEDDLFSFDAFKGVPIVAINTEVIDPIRLLAQSDQQSYDYTSELFSDL